MRQIKIPGACVASVDLPDGRPSEFKVSFVKFLETQLDGYGDAERKTPTQLRQVNKILERVEKAGEAVVKLEDADFDLVKEACKKSFFVQKVGRQLLPFFEAVEAGEEVKV